MRVCATLSVHTLRNRMRYTFILLVLLSAIASAQPASPPRQKPKVTPTPAVQNDTRTNQNQRLIIQAQQLEQTGKLEEALAAYEQYKTTNPGDANGWMGVGRMLTRLRKYDELEAHWKSYLPSAPSYMHTQIEGEIGAAVWMGAILPVRERIGRMQLHRIARIMVTIPCTM